MPTRVSSRRVTSLAAAVAVLGCLISAVHVSAQSPARIEGRVFDARTAQPIEKARVSTASAETSTDRDGRFALPAVGTEGTEITVSAVGYGLARQHVVPGARLVAFPLAQDAVAFEERVEVRPALFDVDPGAPLAHTLQNIELRNLSGVVTDDVLRAVQSMPGVAAGDDFYGTFAIRGSGYQHVGLYIDGVLVTAPFHTIRDLNDAFSLTILNNDVIGGATLISGGAPASYGDRVGAVLNLETRDGNRERTTTRASLGATGTSVFGEGPLGSSGTSWLIGARKSFLDYVVRAILDEPSFVVGYTDVQAKLSHRARGHALSLFMLHGASDYEDSSRGLPRNDVARASAASQLVSARWVWSPSTTTSLKTAGFWTREAGVNRNATAETLFDSTGVQFGGRIDLVAGLGRSHRLRAGFLARRLSGRHAEVAFPRSGAATTVTTFDRALWQPGAYVEDGWASPERRLELTAGVRVDRLSAVSRQAVLPRASGALRLTDRTRLSVATGAFAQFPSLEQFFGRAGNDDLAAEESDQIVVGLERRLSTSLRAQVQVYRQAERRRLGQSHLEPRLDRGVPFVPEAGQSQNAWSGTSKGVEVALQRRSPNGISGWMSYAWGHAELRDTETGNVFDSDYDQRHTVNAYLSYRLSDRTNVSTKFRYGSNLPVPGFYEAVDGGFRLSSDRNGLRLPAYSRLDVRANRTFSIRRARLTTYVEVLNLLNHANYRYTGRSIFLPSGRVSFNQSTQFPLLPAAGVTMEW